jgi:S-DNA-T family DNA segregation ATPase FtsK/SpoIIIE
MDCKKLSEEAMLAYEGAEQALEIFHPRLKNKCVDTAIYNTEPISIEACPRYIDSLVAATNAFFGGFAINAQAVGARLSTAFIYIKIELGKGVRLESIVKYQSDLARDLKEACVNFEVHNGEVTLKVKREDRITVEAGHVFNGNKCKAMDVILGLDRNNDYYTFNLTNMPHMLISGTTGSGKSVAIHSIIASLLTSTPANLLRFMLLDPKQIEFAIYQDLPNLIAPVITCENKALVYVEWLVQEMNRRYSMLSNSGARNIEEYNGAATIKKRLPYIVLVVDELGDLMLGSNSKAFEHALVKLAQKSRAAGIHMILSTQRPSASIFTGLLKSNVPTRLACKVASKMESRIILDQAGAESLLGRGDMLFYVPGMDEPVRIQSPYITNDLIKETVEYCNENLLTGRKISR